MVDYVVHLHAVRTGEKKSAFAFEGAEEEGATEDRGLWKEEARRHHRLGTT